MATLAVVFVGVFDVRVECETHDLDHLRADISLHEPWRASESLWIVVVGGDNEVGLGVLVLK